MCATMAVFARTRALLLLVALGLTEAQYYQFCTNGISEPSNFTAGEPIDVIVAQAPLFSTNPKFGNLLGLLDLFHTATVFAQGSGADRRFWTLEFDFTGGSILTSFVPHFVNDSSAPAGVKLEWDNDARFCLTEGLLWGEKHWSKTFETVAQLTSSQFTKVFHDFVHPLNASMHGGKPQYQLWRVAKDMPSGKEETFIRDTTCNDGTVWLLHYLVNQLGIALPKEFSFNGTSVVAKAGGIGLVNLNSAAEWNSVVDYFRTLKGLVDSRTSMWDRLKLANKFVSGNRYVYDSNHHAYYELFNNSMPWLHAEYVNFPLAGPPASVSGKDVITIV